MEPICSKCGETTGDRYDFVIRDYKNKIPMEEIKKKYNIQNDCTIQTIITYVRVPEDIIESFSVIKLK